MEISKSALRVMNVVWERNYAAAKDIADELTSKCGWNKNTTYTVINQCIKKGFLERSEPGFMCRALVSREDAQIKELHGLEDQMFKGSPKLLFSTLFEDVSLSSEDITEIEQLIAKRKGEVG